MNCILAGVGGQGTVLASKLIAAAAMNKGLFSRTAETIGMAQRGGCVVSHVRIGDEIHSPMIPKGSADVIIGFEPAEAVRCLPYLKEGGTVIVSTKAIKPVTASLSGDHYNGEEMIDYLKRTVGALYSVDADTICESLGSVKALNVVLLGAAAASGALSLSVDEIEQAILGRVPERFHSLNKQALRLGAEAIRKDA